MSTTSRSTRRRRIFSVTAMSALLAVAALSVTGQAAAASSQQRTSAHSIDAAPHASAMPANQAKQRRSAIRQRAAAVGHHLNWHVTGSGQPHARKVAADHAGAHALLLWNARHALTALSSRGAQLPSGAEGATYRLSMLVRTGRPTVNLTLRVAENQQDRRIAVSQVHRVLRGKGWQRMAVRYQVRRADSTLHLAVLAPRLPRHRNFEVNRIQLKLLHLPVVGGPPPTTTPTPAPSTTPTTTPTTDPTTAPTPAPTTDPTTAPTAAPTPAPTTAPTTAPTKTPTSSPSPSSAPHANNCALSANLVPACGLLWGSYAHPSGSENWTTAVTDLEAQLGRPFDITYHYHDFSGAAGGPVNGTIPTSYEKSLAASGHVIFDDWAPQVFATGAQLQWADVAAGDYDSSVIVPVAQSIKAWGQPIMLSIAHEMDAQVGTNGTAADYVAMYRHIHDVFAQQGVTNVVWVWTTTGYSGRYSTIRSLYPGDSYVDWIGYDPYNFDTCLNPSGSWRSLQSTIDPMYQWLESNGFGNKPFILPEWGTVTNPNDPSAAGNWYSQAPSVFASHPNIKAAVQWNDSFGSCNVYLNSQPGELASYANAGIASQIAG